MYITLIDRVAPGSINIVDIFVNVQLPPSVINDGLLFTILFVVLFNNTYGVILPVPAGQ